MTDDKMPLTARLVSAALEALREGDPLVVIGIGNREIHLGWSPEWSSFVGLVGLDNFGKEVSMSENNNMMVGIREMLKVKDGEDVLTAFPIFDDGSRAVVFAVVPGEGSASEKMESIITRWSQL